jgi:hypothetical protein
VDLAPREVGESDRRGDGSRDGEPCPYVSKARTPVTNGCRELPESRI